MMRKELAIVMFVMLMLTLFTVDPAQAVDPDVSVQPLLIEDETMKPLDPPLQSHPTAHQYTAPVTNPENAYDNSQITYSSTNISQQPYPNVYSRPSAYTGSATVSNPTYAYDYLNLDSFAAIDIRGATPVLKDFAVQTFNTTTITTISSLDVHIKYNLTIDAEGSRPWYRIMLYVGTKNLTLLELAYTQIDIDTTTGNWTAIPEPNDGLWSKADVGNIKISIDTNRSQTSDRATFRVFEVWVRVYRPVVKNFLVKTFSPTGISGYSYLDVKINCSIFIGGCSYKIIVSVGSANTTLQNWNDVPQLEPELLAWERVTEPNDGWWNHTDLSTMRIIIETQKTKSVNIGEFRVYEAWVLISPPTVNLYPSSNEVGGVTVTTPAKAYDKNQITYASISLPTTFGTYFAVKSFNTTTPKEHASVDIQMRYNATTFGGGQYKISVYVSGKSVDLQIPTDVNRTVPITAVWHGVCEPNDAVWNQTDLSNLQVRVEKATEGGTCTFREYETWLTFPKDSFTVRVYVSGILVSKTLYAWGFNLTFNKDVLEVVTVADGPFLWQVGFTNFAGFSTGAGWVRSESALDDWESGGVYGNGTLATVTFKAIAEGNSMLNYFTTQLRTRDPITGLPKPITHTRSPGWFRYLTGDVDGDGDVDGVDFGIFAPSYGSSTGQPRYNQNCDLDLDGDVDGVDFGKFAPNYGKT